MDLVENIKKSEGFKGIEYLDSLNIPTIGYGTKLPLSEEEAELILKHRLNKKIDELLQKKPVVMTLSQDRQLVLFEMAYQLGVNGLLKFKKMWDAIDNRDFATASAEMLDSRWHQQTQLRAEKLAKVMGGLSKF